MERADIFRAFQKMAIDKPEFSARLQGEHGENLITQWLESLGDTSLEDFNAAVDKFIATNVNNYFPNVAKIIALLPDKRVAPSYCLRGYHPDGSLIAYHVNRYGEIEDDEGRIYADPNPEVDKMLASKVRSTGKLLTEDELRREAIMYDGQSY